MILEDINLTDFFEKQYCFYKSEMSESFYDTYEYKQIGEN